MNCSETGKALPCLPPVVKGPPQVYAVCVGDDKTTAKAISAEAIAFIPDTMRSTRKRTVASGGVNLCKARVIGEGGNERLVFDPSTDHQFSLEEKIFRHFLPRSAGIEVEQVSAVA